MGIALSLLVLSIAMVRNPSVYAESASIPLSSGRQEMTGTGQLRGEVTQKCKSEPCSPAPSANLGLMIWTPTGEKIAAAVTDAEGHYQITLQKGTYIIQLMPQGNSLEVPASSRNS